MILFLYKYNSFYYSNISPRLACTFNFFFHLEGENILLGALQGLLACFGPFSVGGILFFGLDFSFLFFYLVRKLWFGLFGCGFVGLGLGCGFFWGLSSVGGVVSGGPPGYRIRTKRKAPSCCLLITCLPPHRAPEYSLPMTPKDSSSISRYFFPPRQQLVGFFFSFPSRKRRESCCPVSVA